MRKKLLFLCLSILILLNFLNVTKINAYAKEQVVISKELQEICEKYGEEFDICPELLESIIWHESRGKVTAENGCHKGLTQINPKYFKTRMESLGITDLFDPDQNIHLCASTLRDYFDENEDLYYVLMCWNSGTNKAKELYKQGLYTKYAVKVSQTSYELERQHGK